MKSRIQDIETTKYPSIERLSGPRDLETRERFDSNSWSQSDIGHRDIYT